MPDDVHPSSTPTVDRSLVVSFLDERTIVESDTSLTFGRRGDLVIDPENRTLHRELGRFDFETPHWWLSNLGSSIALVVRDIGGGSSTRIAPGDRLPIAFAAATVSFAAGRANYLLTAEQPGLIGRGGIRRPPDTLLTEATITASRLRLNDEQQALVDTLVRLERTPRPAAGAPTRADLADALGWSDAKVRRKLDHLCSKLGDAGVPGLVGGSGGAAHDRRRRLAEAAVDLGLVDIATPELD